MNRELTSMAGMSLGTLFSRLTGFAKWAMLGAALGFSPMADAYNLAHILPTMIYELVLGGILTAVLIPVVVEQLAAQDRDQAWLAVSKLVNAAALVLLAVTLSCWLAAPWLVRLQTLKIDGADRKLVQFFFAFFTPQVLFYGLSAIGTGLLNARHRFTMAAFAPVLNNLAVIASLALYLLWPAFGEAGLAIGTTLGVLLQALVLAPSLRAAGFRYFPAVDFRHPAVVKMVRLSGPVALYVIFNQVNLTVQNNLAIPLQGGVSALQYAFAFYVLPHGLLAVSIGTVMLPGLSELAIGKDWAGFARKVEQGLSWSAAVIVPAMAVYLAMSLPIVEVLMQRGRFTTADSSLLATVLSCYSLGLLSFTVYLFINRVFYSLQDTWTPLALNFTGNLANSVFNLLAVGSLGVPALALGHALGYTVIAAAGVVLIARRVRQINMRPVLASLVRVAAASAVVGLFGLAVSQAWARWLGEASIWGKAGIMGAARAAAGVVYLAAAKAAGVTEIGALAELARQRFGKRRLGGGGFSDQGAI
jgi:putative peptidoglycan lipid II flippase